MFSQREKEQTSCNTSVLGWQFSLPEPGTGVMIGNGPLGLMVWGNENLCVTVGRNGFWERRTGSPPDFGTSFRKLQHLLETDDKEGIESLFDTGKLKEKFGFTQHALGNTYILEGETLQGELLELNTLKGQTLVLSRSTERQHTT